MLHFWLIDVPLGRSVLLVTLALVVGLVGCCLLPFSGLALPCFWFSLLAGPSLRWWDGGLLALVLVLPAVVVLRRPDTLPGWSPTGAET